MCGVCLCVFTYECAGACLHVCIGLMSGVSLLCILRYCLSLKSRAHWFSWSAASLLQESPASAFWAPGSWVACHANLTFTWCWGSEFKSSSLHNKYLQIESSPQPLVKIKSFLFFFFKNKPNLEGNLFRDKKSFIGAYVKAVFKRGFMYHFEENFWNISQAKRTGDLIIVCGRLWGKALRRRAFPVEVFDGKAWLKIDSLF